METNCYITSTWWIFAILMLSQSYSSKLVSNPKSQWQQKATLEVTEPADSTSVEKAGMNSLYKTFTLMINYCREKKIRHVDREKCFQRISRKYERLCVKISTNKKCRELKRTLRLHTRKNILEKGVCIRNNVTKVYNVASHICCEGQVKRLHVENSLCCRHHVINSNEDLCCNDTIHLQPGEDAHCCGKAVYNRAIQFCLNEKVHWLKVSDDFWGEPHSEDMTSYSLFVALKQEPSAVDLPGINDKVDVNKSATTDGSISPSSILNIVIPSIIVVICLAVAATCTVVICRKRLVKKPLHENQNDLDNIICSATCLNLQTISTTIGNERVNPSFSGNSLKTFTESAFTSSLRSVGDSEPPLSSEESVEDIKCHAATLLMNNGTFRRQNHCGVGSSQRSVLSVETLELSQFETSLYDTDSDAEFELSQTETNGCVSGIALSQTETDGCDSGFVLRKIKIGAYDTDSGFHEPDEYLDKPTMLQFSKMTLDQALSKNFNTAENNMTMNLFKDNTTQTFPLKKSNMRDCFGNPFQFNAVISKGHSTIEVEDSDVILKLPEKDLESNNIECFGSSHSDIQAVTKMLGLEKNEFLVSPVVEYVLQGILRLLGYAVIKMPFCGRIKDLHVWRVIIDEGKEKAAKRIEVPRRVQFDETVDTFYVPDLQNPRFVYIYTKVFSLYTCTKCNGRDSEINLIAYLYGNMKRMGVGEVRVQLKLYILNEIYIHKDYSSKLDKEEVSYGSRRLEWKQIELPSKVSDKDQLTTYLNIGDKSSWDHVRDPEEPNFEVNKQVIPFGDVAQCHQTLPCKRSWDIESKAEMVSSIFKCYVYVEFACKDDTNTCCHEDIKKTHFAVAESLEEWQMNDAVHSKAKLGRRELLNQLSIASNNTECTLLHLDAGKLAKRYDDDQSSCCNYSSYWSESESDQSDIQKLPNEISACAITSITPKFDVRRELPNTPQCSYMKREEENGRVTFGRPEHILFPDRELTNMFLPYVSSNNGSHRHHRGKGHHRSDRHHGNHRNQSHRRNRRQNRDKEDVSEGKNEGKSSKQSCSASASGSSNPSMMTSSFTLPPRIPDQDGGSSVKAASRSSAPALNSQQNIDKSRSSSQMDTKQQDDSYLYNPSYSSNTI